MHTTKEKAELMLWFDESKDHKVECRSRDDGEWFVTNLPNWDWPDFDYRKYEPPKPPREVWVHWRDGNGCMYLTEEEVMHARRTTEYFFDDGDEVVHFREVVE